MDPGATKEEILDQFAAMDRPTIPQPHNRVSQVTEQLFEELAPFFSSQGTPMELDVERHPFMLGRHRQGLEGVDPPLFVPHGTAGRLALWGPGAFQVGNKQKAAFVQENQVRPKPCGLFLYAAPRNVSSAQWRSRCVDMLAVRVSDNSSPSVVRDTTGHWGGNECETLARRPWRGALASTTRFGSLWPARRALRPEPSGVFARGRAKRAAPEWAGHVSRPCPVADKCAPTARLSSVRHRLFGRLSPVICLAARVGSHGVAAGTIEALLLGVSFP
jgi:hypothetical protein